MLYNRCLALSKKTFQAAETGKKNIIVQLKDNQKELVKNCNDIVKYTKPTEEHIDQGYGRNTIETRIIKKYKDNDFIEDHQWKKYVKNVYTVERIVNKMNTKSKKYQQSYEKAFYLSNIELSAKEAGEVIRKHWYIENTNHYVRDVSMLEDASRIRVNPDNIARIRSIALNVMRKNRVENVKGEMYQNSIAFNRLYSYKHFI